MPGDEEHAPIFLSLCLPHGDPEVAAAENQSPMLHPGQAAGGDFALTKLPWWHPELEVGDEGPASVYRVPRACIQHLERYDSLTRLGVGPPLIGGTAVSATGAFVCEIEDSPTCVLGVHRLVYASF